MLLVSIVVVATIAVLLAASGGDGKFEHKGLTRVEHPKEEVFEFLSRVENLPEWATEFARELEYEDGKAKVVNGLGEFFFTIEADPRTGVIDMFAGPSEHELAIFPTRVVALGPVGT